MVILARYELEANGIDYKIRLAHIINGKLYEFLSAGSLSSQRNSNFRIQHTFPTLKLLNATLNDNQWDIGEKQQWGEE